MFVGCLFTTGSYQAVNQIMVGVALAVAPALVAILLSRAPARLWWLLTAVVGLAAVETLRMNRQIRAREAAHG